MLWLLLNRELWIFSRSQPVLVGLYGKGSSQALVFVCVQTPHQKSVTFFIIKYVKCQFGYAVSFHSISIKHTVIRWEPGHTAGKGQLYVNVFLTVKLTELELPLWVSTVTWLRWTPSDSTGCQLLWEFNSDLSFYNHIHTYNYYSELSRFLNQFRNHILCCVSTRQCKHKYRIQTQQLLFFNPNEFRSIIFTCHQKVWQCCLHNNAD